MTKKQNIESALIQDLQKVEGNNKSDLRQVVDMLLNSQFRRRKTILKSRIIAPLTTLDTIGQLYEIDFVNAWVDRYIQYLISEGGQGRKDIVDITKFTLDKEITAQNNILNALGRR